VSDCCHGNSTDEPVDPGAAAQCPECGQRGLKVKPITLDSMLSLEDLQGVRREAVRFCSTLSCPLAYYGPENLRFTVEQVKVPIYQKDRSDEVPVCYCFEVSRGEAKRALAAHQGGELYDAVTARAKQEGCDCETMNPQGSCCFGNLRRLLEGS